MKRWWNVFFLSAFSACAPTPSDRASDEGVGTAVSAVSSAPLSAQCSLVYWNFGFCHLVIAVPLQGSLTPARTSRIFPLDSFSYPLPPALIESGEGGSWQVGFMRTFRVEMWRLRRTWLTACTNQDGTRPEICYASLSYADPANPNNYMSLRITARTDIPTSVMPDIQVEYGMISGTPNWATAYALLPSAMTTLGQRTTIDTTVAGWPSIQVLRPQPLGVLVGDMYPGWHTVP